MISISCNDDYATLEIMNKLTFYYGYEVLWCTKHNCLVEGSKKCLDMDCYETSHVEWCFSANIFGKWFYIPQSKIEKQMENWCKGREPAYYLLAGIGIILKKVLKRNELPK